MKKNKADIKIIFRVIGFITFNIVALTAVGLVFWQGFQPFLVGRDLFQNSQNIIKKNTEKTRLLDGTYIKKTEKEKYPVAVLIDNKYEARPWSALSYAGLVYEAPVEGGIGRFLAIYSTEKDLEKIGPVRSIRPYFIDWAMGTGALLVHVGGSPGALNIIKKNKDIKALDLDEFANQFYFWRSRDRLAPHNLYTSSVRLNKAINKKLKNQELRFFPWQFKDDAFDSEKGDVEKIRINFGIYKNHDAIWRYDKNKNVYVRYFKNKVLKDDNSALMLAKNIAVMETDIWIIDSESRRKIKTIGSGKALIFQDGKRVDARWEKKSQGERLRFYDKGGNEIRFNRGTTWVEVVSSLKRVTE